MERDKTLDRLDKHLVSIGKRIGHSDNGVTAFICNEIDELRKAIADIRRSLCGSGYLGQSE